MAWYGDELRHSKAAQGIPTGRKDRTRKSLNFKKFTAAHGKYDPVDLSIKFDEGTLDEDEMIAFAKYLRASGMENSTGTFQRFCKDMEEQGYDLSAGSTEQKPKRLGYSGGLFSPEQFGIFKKNHDSIARAFAKGATSGEGSNLFIDHDIIYSYGRHFPVAVKMAYPNGNREVWFNKDKYSQSTTRHQQRVRRALEEHGWTIVEKNTSELRALI